MADRTGWRKLGPRPYPVAARQCGRSTARLWRRGVVGAGLAASIPVRLLGEGNGRSVLDLCAAPGGKTLQLASQGWAVTALDLSAKRLMAVERQSGAHGSRLRNRDRRSPQWDADKQYDAVLLDAPCTATGTFRRHPDVLHRIGARQIAELVALQTEMLDRAAAWVKPGGWLVYATCSLEPEEGEAQAESFLHRDPEFHYRRRRNVAARRRVIAARPCPHPSSLLADKGGLGRFFVAGFIRAA